MGRVGIYINGKEVIARYVGNRLVWQKEIDKLFLTTTINTKWSSSFTNNLTAETNEITSISSHNDVSVDITRISVDDRVWKAKQFSYFFNRIRSTRYRMYTRITFQNQQDKADFINFVNSKSSIILKLYAK